MALQSKGNGLDTLTAESKPGEAGRLSFVVKACGISVDFSRQRISAEVLSSLARLADERNLIASHRKMATGEIVNISEGRAALLALLEYRNAVELDVGSLCVLPYDERLNMIVPWLQQLEMESLGKSSDKDGKPITHRTGLPVWGGNGDEAQHSFGQWLREGTGSTAIDVIWPEIPGHKYAPHYRCLVSNAKAQCEALVTRPCASDKFNVLTAMMLDALVPRRIGALMALYEHKTTMLATLFKVNAFDQPGVEYGKKLSREVEREVVSERRCEACSQV